MSQPINKSTKIIYGVVVAKLAYSAFVLLFLFFTNNVYSPFAGEELMYARDPIFDAFAVQQAGYQLAIFVIAIIAFVKNTASGVFLVSLWIVIADSFDLIVSLFHGMFSLQSMLAALVVCLSGYCAYQTRHVFNQNAN